MQLLLDIVNKMWIGKDDKTFHVSISDESDN